MILADNLSSYMTHIVNPVEGQDILKAGDRTAVLFIDLISSVSLTNNKSGILQAFNEDYFPFIDVSMYMEYCVDQEAKDTIRDIMETKNC